MSRSQMGGNAAAKAECETRARRLGIREEETGGMETKPQTKQKKHLLAPVLEYQTVALAHAVGGFGREQDSQRTHSREWLVRSKGVRQLECFPRSFLKNGWIRGPCKRHEINSWSDAESADERSTRVVATPPPKTMVAPRESAVSLSSLGAPLKAADSVCSVAQARAALRAAPAFRSRLEYPFMRFRIVRFDAGCVRP